jgi:6-pyruvoyltetrahydropterin/6-carboxytetrahydropterin synthase
MFEVSIRKTFSAAHHLRGYKGNCSNFHGHNWVVTVSVQSEKLDEVGISIDFRKLKQELDIVIEKLDHSNLNDLDEFSGINPTSELIARFIFQEISGKIASSEIRVSKVIVSESEHTSAAYFQRTGKT